MREFSPSREFLLVAACCAFPVTGERIRELAKGAIDWNRFCRLVERHRVAGLVHQALTRAQAPVPPAIGEDFAAQASALAQRDLTLAAEAIRLNRLFAENGIAIIFLKGSTLGLLAYGRLGLRYSKDIDILVSESDAAAAGRILERAGYRREMPPTGTSENATRLWRILRKDYFYVHPAQAHEVELHWRLFDNPELAKPLASSPQSVALGGQGALNTPGEDDLFAYLCLHGAQHGWMRLKWLADIAALVSPMSDARIAGIHATAKARNAGAASAQALLLCHRLLQTNIPPALLARLQSDANAARLERIGLWALTAGNEETAPPDLPFGGLRLNLSHFLLARGWRYWAEELKLVLVSPNDALMAPLPRPLWFAYPFLRLPLWIWRKIGRSSGRA